MYAYGVAPRFAKWAAGVVWIAFLLILSLEGSDPGIRVLGLLPAATVGYALTMLLMVAFPRRSLTDIALIVVTMLVLPEIVASAFSGVEAIRMLCEIAVVPAALVPARVERARRGEDDVVQRPLLGGFGSSIRRTWFSFEMRPVRPVHTALPGAAFKVQRPELLTSRESEECV